AGLCAALLTGFVNTQPVYFVNWGRYTQLTGQLLLPVVLVSWMALTEAVNSPTLRLSRARLGALSAILTACLILTHYIVTIFAALCVGFYLVLLALLSLKPRAWLRLGAASALVALFALVLATPWLLNTWSGHLAVNTSALISDAAGAQRIEDYSSLPPVTPYYIKDFILGFAVLGVLVCAWRREWRVLWFVLWTVSLLLTVRPQMLGLPGAGVVDWFTAYLALYVTIIPLASYPLGVLYRAVLHNAQRLGRGLTFSRLGGRSAYVVLAIGLIVVMGWGINWQMSVLDPSFQLLTPADWRAMQWIRDNTPQDSRFLVNSFPAFGGTLLAGSDGGWWLPLLTGRKSNLPPITYGTELWNDPDYYRQVNALGETLRGKSLYDPSPIRVDLTQPRLVNALRMEGIQYVYHGAHANPPPGAADYIDVQPLLHSPTFRLVYERGGVEIFQIVNSE
ncbi:MAG: hypothetical protein LC737_06570, partial [Chloroflexi bacterium]|nr:hypothetical protein [Chloroflexota bacterium]